MADPVNTDVEKAFSLINGPLTIVDDQVANVINSQATALRVRGQIFVVTSGANGGSVVLPSINGGDAPPFCIIVNETLIILRIGGAAGDALNGTLTPSTMANGPGTINLGSKSSAFCVASQTPFGKRGGAGGSGSLASPNNWHVALMVN